MFSLDGLYSFQVMIDRITQMEATMKAVSHVAGRQIGERVRLEAISMIGKYFKGSDMYPAWPALSINTLARRSAKGTGRTPLLETGQMRDSIQVSSPQETPFGIVYIVGYSARFPGAMYAPHHEMGTSKMPPRPVMGPAAQKVMHGDLKGLLGPIVWNHFNMGNGLSGLRSAKSVSSVGGRLPRGRKQSMQAVIKALSYTP